MNEARVSVFASGGRVPKKGYSSSVDNATLSLKRSWKESKEIQARRIRDGAFKVQIMDME